MKQPKTLTIIGIITVLLTGTLAHFAYEWSGNNHIVGLFTPVNESVWEHMKLLFFPMLAYSLFQVFQLKKEFPCIVSASCFGILVGTWLIPALYYAYTFVLGKNTFLLDIATFVLSTLAAFLLSYRLTQSCGLKSYTLLLVVLVCVLLACFFRFTYSPPDSELFRDPSVSQES